MRHHAAQFAGVAHLVERHLAKVEVAGSSPVARSKKGTSQEAGAFLIEKGGIIPPARLFPPPLNAGWFY